MPVSVLSSICVTEFGACLPCVSCPSRWWLACMMTSSWTTPCASSKTCTSCECLSTLKKRLIDWQPLMYTLGGVGTSSDFVYCLVAPVVCASYYHGEPAKLPAGHRPKNVAICLAVYRSQILKGLSIAFSGLLSRQMDPRTSDLGYMAQALGAEVTDVLTERTTHVVAERTNTEKVVEGAKRPHVHIVTRLWLHLSFLHCERKDEKAYALPGVARGGDLGDKDKNGEAREAKKEATTSKAEGDNETKGNGGGNGEGAREEEGAKEDGKKRKRERDDARGAGAKAGNGAHKDAEEDEGTTGDQDADASHVKGGDGREGESGDESLVDFAIEDGDEVHDDEGEEA